MNERPGESPGAECLRLQEEARVARRRFQLYKARTYGSGVTDGRVLFRLERAFLLAENRLRGENPARPSADPPAASHEGRRPLRRAFAPPRST